MKAAQTLKNKLMYGKASSEPEDFLKAYQKVLDLHKKLKRIDNALKKWLKEAKTISKSTADLGLAFGVDIKTLSTVQKEVETHLTNNFELAIHRKIELIVELEQRRYCLEILRLDRDQCKRNLTAFQMKQEKNKAKGLPENPQQEEILNKWLNDATALYERELRDLTSAIEYTNTEAESHDELGTIWEDLQSFRSEQFLFFLSTQKLTLVRQEEEIEELEKNWRAFNQKS